MSSTVRRTSATLYLLVGVLVFAASGVLSAAPHDHDPNEYCRSCSLGKRIQTPVDETPTDSPDLEAATAPVVTAAVDTSDCLLVDAPLRGPPHTA